jgi:hypothetical protein
MKVKRSNPPPFAYQSKCSRLSGLPQNFRQIRLEPRHKCHRNSGLSNGWGPRRSGPIAAAARATGRPAQHRVHGMACAHPMDEGPIDRVREPFISRAAFPMEGDLRCIRPRGESMGHREGTDCAREGVPPYRASSRGCRALFDCQGLQILSNDGRIARDRKHKEEGRDRIRSGFSGTAKGGKGNCGSRGGA